MFLFRAADESTPSRAEIGCYNGKLCNRRSFIILLLYMCHVGRRAHAGEGGSRGVTGARAIPLLLDV